MATMANQDRETTQTTCQNCSTSTTPLWRRDEMGAVLCNACGLFLKLHGRPRPISLKTDVIKSRNRVKTMRPDMAKQKKNQGLPTNADMNGVDFGNQTNGAAAARRASQRSLNGNPDDTNSPISRTGTPNMYNAQIAPMYPTLEDQFQPQHLPNFGAPDGRAQSPTNGERPDMPQTHEQLMNANASLKTRVSELEVIQELYRGRIHQLESEEQMRQVQEAGKPDDQLHSQVAGLTDSNTQLQQLNSQLQAELDESHRRENMLKRRLDELEVELKEAKESIEAQEEGRHAKKPRLDDTPAETVDATTPPKEDA